MMAAIINAVRQHARWLPDWHSLHVQVIGAVVGVLTLGLTLLVILAGTQMSDLMLNDFIHERRITAVALASSLGEQIENWRANDRTALQRISSRLAIDANRLHLHISIISPTGDLIAASPSAKLTFTDHSPEIIGALRNTVSTDLRNNRLYVAVPIAAENSTSGEISGVIWLDASMTSIQIAMRDRWLMLISTTLGVLALAGVAGWWISARIVQPVKDIQSVAELMAAGDLQVRVNINKNTSELASLGAAFNHMAVQVGDIIQRQRDFTSNASHELRSPLASIKLRSEALSTGQLDADRSQQYAAEINGEVTRLANLVSDLLMLSRAAQYTFTPPQEPLNVQDELTISLKMITLRLTAKQQTISLTCDPNLPAIYMHSRDLHTMVDNLLDNAVKYTPDGGHIDLVSVWDGATLTISICDNGVGIPPELLPRVIEPFYRVDRAHTRAIVGTGLGLALVAAIATQYSGNLAITSDGVPTHGTQARLLLHPKPEPSTAIT